MIIKEHVIILVSYNDIYSTIAYIDRTCNYSSVDAIVLVDNCSTNDLYNIVLRHINEVGIGEKVSCIKSEKNGGYAYGNNFGIKYAIKKFSPKFISISNSDVILNDKAIKDCIGCLESNINLGFIAPRMKNIREESVDTTWKLPTFIDVILDNLIVLKPLLKNNKIILKNRDNIEIVDAIPGAYFIGRTSTFEHIDFFDESTFLYYEENILAYKIKSIGKQNAILNSIEYIHNHSESISKNIPSVANRLNILRDSTRIYNKKYLKTNILQDIIYEITYWIGKYSYIFFIKLLGIKR